MGQFQTVLLIFVCIFGGIICWSYGASYLRVARSRSSWATTPGRVEWFGLNYGIPAISYEFTVDGKSIIGNKFTPGPLASYPKRARTSFPKSTYLNPDGTLRFPPGGQVEVFYDPGNPSDSALLRDLPSEKGFLIIVPILALFLFGILHARWISQNVGIVVSLFFTLIGLFFALFMGIPWVRRFLVSRRFPSVPGELITAEVVYQASTGGGEARYGGGYVVDLEFAYRVDGITYRSQQFGPLPFFVLKSRAQDVQSQIDRLNAETELRVYYDPAAPWDGFLSHVQMLGAISPLLMGILACLAGIFFALRQSPRGFWAH